MSEFITVVDSKKKDFFSFLPGALGPTWFNVKIAIGVSTKVKMARLEFRYASQLCDNN